MAGVDSIVSTLLHTVSQILINESSSILNASADLELLQGELKFMQEFLRHSEREPDEVKEVVKQIRVAALEAENIIDDFVIKMAKHKRRNLLLRFFHGGELILLLRNAAANVKHIRKKIDEINANRDKYNITSDKDAVSKRSTIQSRRQNVEIEDVVCFDNEAKLVIKKLDTQDSRRDVVSIIGMGGLGKTTLARKIFKGDFVKKFDCAAWADVSQVYSHKDLLQKIAETVLHSYEMEEFNKLDLLHMTNRSSTEDGKEKLIEEKLVRELVKVLKIGLASKRYFIVLDDVWEKFLWDEIKEAFPENGKSSRVLLTSRVKDVALQASICTSPYFLPFLDEGDSWKLFSRKVFHDHVCPPKLEEFVRKQILTKCQGLPLAIVAVAGILRKREQSMWSKVADDLKRYIAQLPNECLGVLALSYEELPPHLKPCFLYFGVYPEDFEIPVRQLIRLWVAEGFIDQDNNSNSDMEDVAEDYLLELIDRSLIQISRKRTDGGVKTCRIHDLLRDLAIAEGKKEMFLSVDRKVEEGSLPVNQPRRLSIHFYGSRHLSNYLSRFSQLRSLLSFGGEEQRYASYDLDKDSFSRLSKFCRYLRVLDLGSGRFCSKVEKLVQLRYLRMQFLKEGEIPSSITKLVNLQILDILVGIREAHKEFSGNLWEMQQLRHLFLSNRNFRRISIPKGNLWELPNLRTLSFFSLESEDDADILKMFPNLKKLRICCIKFKGVFEYLSKLQCLQTLKIRGGFRLTDPGALPLSLTKITLYETWLDTSDFSKLGGIPNLQVLKLLYSSLRLRGRKLETSIDKGQFPRLKVLTMRNLGIKEWSMEGPLQGFQSLVHLSFNDCPDLKAIPEQLKQLSSLRQLNVGNCSALKESLKQIWVNDARLVI